MMFRRYKLWLGAIIWTASAVGLVYQSVALHAVSGTKTAGAKTVVTVLEPPVAKAQVMLRESADVPILMYHDTPADFEAQLQHLAAYGYTTITMADLHAALTAGGDLPSKPVIITFDDGLANQMDAFSLLQKYQMKATFYIITGGEASHWCIGADRRYGPGYECGDSYLSWDQVKQLDKSGLIEIGSHMLDHLEMSKQTVETQRTQLVNSKASLETQLGHPVLTVAYPYGSFTQTTVDLASEAGFTTAVTTKPGQIHSKASLLTTPRIRSVNNLK